MQQVPLLRLAELALTGPATAIPAVRLLAAAAAAAAAGAAPASAPAPCALTQNCSCPGVRCWQKPCLSPRGSGRLTLGEILQMPRPTPTLQQGSQGREAG
jgi:hypothetical protein